MIGHKIATPFYEHSKGKPNLIASNSSNGHAIRFGSVRRAGRGRSPARARRPSPRTRARPTRPRPRPRSARARRAHRPSPGQHYLSFTG